MTPATAGAMRGPQRGSPAGVLSTALRNYGDVFGVRRQSEAGAPRGQPAWGAGAAPALWIAIALPFSQIEQPKRCRAQLATALQKGSDTLA
jgi:hypothetical protein